MWRSTADGFYTTPAVSRGRVWTVRVRLDGTHLVAFSTACTPRAGICSPRVAVTLADGPRARYGAPTVADGLVFVGFTPEPFGNDGGVVIVPANCPVTGCAPLAHLPGQIAVAPVSISEGRIYLVHEQAEGDGHDPGPWPVWIDAYALPDG